MPTEAMALKNFIVVIVGGRDGIGCNLTWNCEPMWRQTSKTSMRLSETSRRTKFNNVVRSYGFVESGFLCRAAWKLFVGHWLHVKS